MCVCVVTMCCVYSVHMVCMPCNRPPCKTGAACGVGSHARQTLAGTKVRLCLDTGMHADATTLPKAQARPVGPPNPLRRAAIPALSLLPQPSPALPCSLLPPTSSHQQARAPPAHTPIVSPAPPTHHLTARRRRAQTPPAPTEAARDAPARTASSAGRLPPT